MALIKTERPDELESKVHRVRTGLGALYITISIHEGRPFEMIATISKSGRDVNAMTEALGRLISLWLQAGGGIEDIIKQLKGIGGENPLASGKGIIHSIPDAIAQLLERKYIKEDK